MQRNTSPSNPDRHIIKKCILWLKGMCPGSMGPHAATQHNFRLRTASLGKSHASINKTVEWRAKMCQNQADQLGQGRPALQLKKQQMCNHNQHQTSTPKAVPSGNNPRPAGLGETSRPPTCTSHDPLQLAVSLTIKTAYKLSIYPRTDLGEL
jgi:hypothetical protein